VTVFRRSRMTVTVPPEGPSEWYSSEPKSTMSLVFDAVCTASQLPDDLYNTSVERIADVFLAINND
jgi:hypothetical protein